MKKFLLQVFTWWNGQTLGTRFYTWLKGRPVGLDQFGNRYYENPRTGRRWVIYNGPTEATATPPGWHGWLRHTVDIPPSAEAYTPRAWEREHVPNLTGTPYAYRPKGSILTPERRPEVTGDYEPWKP